MKRRILLLCLIVALLSMISLGTYAYYTTTQQTRNVITTGGIRFELLETGADGAAFPSEPMVILPGDVVSKTVRVENTGGHPMYLRIRLTPGVNDPALTTASTWTSTNPTGPMQTVIITIIPPWSPAIPPAPCSPR